MQLLLGILPIIGFILVFILILTIVLIKLFPAEPASDWTRSLKFIPDSFREFIYKFRIK